MCVDRGKRTNNKFNVGLKKAPGNGAFFNFDLLIVIVSTINFLSQNDRAVGGEVEFADHAIFNAIRSIAELIL